MVEAGNPRKNPLSTEFMVACEIVKLRENGETVWLSKLVETMDKKPSDKRLSKATIARAITTLFDWGIVKGEYGETSPGRAGRLLLICNEAESLVFDLYTKYWKE
jgi:predicted transcriptional regulator